MNVVTILLPNTSSAYYECIDRTKMVYPEIKVITDIPEEVINRQLCRQAISDMVKVLLLSKIEIPTLFIDADVIANAQINIHKLTKPSFVNVQGDPDVWMIYSNGSLDHRKFYQQCYHDMIVRSKVNSTTLQSIIIKNRPYIQLINIGRSIEHLYLSRGQHERTKA